MDIVARQAPEERRLLFEQTAAGMGVLATLVEKDFWVCFCLRLLFSLEGDAHPRLLFRGGTSLSKCYRLIQRFSEDIDLTLNRHDLGFEGDNDPVAAASTSQLNKRRKRLEAKVAEYVEEALFPAVKDGLESMLSDTSMDWSLSYEGKGNVHFAFPGAGLEKSDYFRPYVLLEIAAMGDLEPSETSEIQPYAAEYFPQLFNDPSFQVSVIASRRTLCDKVLLLHRVHHLSEEIPVEHARHYYDVAMLYQSSAWEGLSSDMDLLAHASKYEQASYPRKDASYETMQRGTFRIVPREDQLPSLRADYKKMSQNMLFSGGPELEEVLAAVKELESELNDLSDA